MSTILFRARVVVMLLVTAASPQEMPKDQPPIWSAKPDVATSKKWRTIVWPQRNKQ